VAAEADCTPAVGVLLAGRYRLAAPVPPEPGDVGQERHWRGVDEVLARPVLVTVLPSGKAAAHDLLASAVANGRVAHPGIASVFDAADCDGYTYVVTEWVEGRPLTALLRDGPLPPAQAAAIVGSAADAVATMHSQGLAHGNLHPDNVLVTDGGGVKLTALRTAAGGAATADISRLGAVLYATLTARWPAATVGVPAQGIADAPYADGRLCSPRQARAGVPRPLSEVTMRALAGPGSALTATDLAEHLHRHADDADTGRLPVVEADAPAPAPRSRWRRGVVLISILLLISVAGLLLGLRLGAIPAPTRGYLPFDSRGAQPGATPAPATGGPLRVVAARILDPQGDGTEVGNADRTIDGPAGTGDARTVWRTDDYTTPHFGNLKRGMGVLLDLGAPAAVSQVSVILGDPGGTFDVRAGDTASDNPADYRTLVTQHARTTTVNSSFGTAQTARYWLIWFTELAPHHGQFGIGVAAVRFRGATPAAG